MPDSGSGTGTPIACGTPGTATAGVLCSPAIPLWMYAETIGYACDAFFGIVRDDPPAYHTNKPLWRKSERDMVEHFLAEAQQEIEQICKYPLWHCWIEDEEHDYEYPLLSDWAKVIESGVQATAAMSVGQAVNHANDPAVVGPFIDPTGADEDEIRVFHPGTADEIFPSAIAIAGNTVTLTIPRCRLLTEEAYAELGVDYDDTGVGGSFELTVDVVRVYNDPSTQGVLVWSHGTGSCALCTGTTATACIVTTNREIGEMDVVPANYSDGAWSSSTWSCYCHHPDRVRINYHAGLTVLTKRARDAIIRLAHAKMPHDPCNVDPPLWIWAADRNVPRALTAQRLNCPFGLEDGAWQAYKFAKSMKTYRGSVL